MRGSREVCVMIGGVVADCSASIDLDLTFQGHSLGRNVHRYPLS